MNLIDENGLRIDGRKPGELRPLKIEVGVLKTADGSAYIEWGKNKIFAAVHGPKECHPKHIAMADRAVLKCRYHMTPFSVPDRKAQQPSRREIELSKVIREALTPALILEEYPRTAIEIYIEVLTADAGTRAAGITAAAAALADAGITMRDLVVSVAAGKAQDHIILDLCDEEDKEGQVDLPVAYMPNLDQVTLLQMDGPMSREEFEEAFNMAKEACKTVYKVQREAVISKYFGDSTPKNKGA
jgi:exosome complex component RRP41